MRLRRTSTEIAPEPVGSRPAGRVRRAGRVGRVVLGLALVAAGGLGAAWAGTRDDGASTTVTAYFSQTVGLYPGSDVRMLGVPVGTVRSVTPEGSRVKVGLTLDSGFSAAPDTGAVIVSPSLVSDRYVQLTKPWKDGPRLASGTVIEEDRTAVPVELDDLYRSLDDVSKALGPKGANKDGALSEALTTGARNLKGLGPQINQMLRDFSRLGGTLADSSDPLFGAVRNLQSFNSELVANDTQVAEVNRQFADVSAYLAADRQDLASALSSLTDALGRVQVFIRDNRAHLASSVKGLTGTAQVLRRQRDSLDEMLRRAPGAIQNLLRAYDPQRQVLRGRVDLNEISLWNQATSPPGTPGATRTSGGAGTSGGTSGSSSRVPLLLPSIGATR